MVASKCRGSPARMTGEAVRILVGCISQRRDLDDQALKLAQAAAEAFPDMSAIVRNYARALTVAKRGAEALEWHQRSIKCRDTDDAAAIWLGNYLHNCERHVDAVEVFLRACMFDPDDADGFAHVADEIAWAMRRQQIEGVLGSVSRILPDSANDSVIMQAIVAAFSCPAINQQDIGRCKRAAASTNRYRWSRADVRGRIGPPQDSVKTSREERWSSCPASTKDSEALSRRIRR